jgi:hypothetical protein
MKLFILEVSVNKAYKELGIAHNTAHKIYIRIRECIYTSEDDELLGVRWRWMRVILEERKEGKRFAR